MTRHSLFFASLLLAASASPISYGGPPRGDYVRIDPIAAVDVTSGGFATALVQFTVKDGFHVQANPAANPQLVATVLNLPAAGKTPPLTLGPIEYPRGQNTRLKGSDTPLSTYSGRVTLQISVAAAATAKAATKKIETTLRYQACDETTCFFPQTDTIEIPVRIVAKAKSSR